MRKDIIYTYHDKNHSGGFSDIRFSLGQLVEPAAYGNGTHSYTDREKERRKSGAYTIYKRKAKPYGAGYRQRDKAAEE